MFLDEIDLNQILVLIIADVSVIGMQELGILSATIEGTTRIKTKDGMVNLISVCLSYLLRRSLCHIFSNAFSLLSAELQGRTSTIRDVAVGCHLSTEVLCQFFKKRADSIIA